MNFAELLSIAQKNDSKARELLKTSKDPVLEYKTPAKHEKSKPDIEAIKARLKEQQQKANGQKPSHPVKKPVSNGPVIAKHPQNGSSITRKSNLDLSGNKPKEKNGIQPNSSISKGSAPKLAKHPEKSAGTPGSVSRSSIKTDTSKKPSLNAASNGSNKPADTKKQVPRRIIPPPPTFNYTDLLKLANKVQQNPDAPVDIPPGLVPMMKPRADPRKTDSQPPKKLSARETSSGRAISNSCISTPKDRREMSQQKRPNDSGPSRPLVSSKSQQSSSTSIRNGKSSMNSSSSVSRPQPQPSSVSRSQPQQRPPLPSSRPGMAKAPSSTNVSAAGTQLKKPLPAPMGSNEPLRNRRPPGMSRPLPGSRPAPGNDVSSSNGKIAPPRPGMAGQSAQNVAPVQKPAAPAWQNPYTRDDRYSNPLLRPAVKKRPLPEDDYEEDDDYDSDMADFIDDGDPDHDTEHISKEIRSIFKYDPKRYAARDRMALPSETRAMDQWREEAYSLRVAKMEDAEEEERERLDLLRKKKLKR